MKIFDFSWWICRLDERRHLALDCKRWKLRNLPNAIWELLHWMHIARRWLPTWWAIFLYSWTFSRLIASFQTMKSFWSCIWFCYFSLGRMFTLLPYALHRQVVEFTANGSTVSNVSTGLEIQRKVISFSLSLSLSVNLFIWTFKIKKKQNCEKFS